MPEVQVENIVISCPIAQTLDLAVLASAMAQAIYNPEETPVLLVQIPRPHAAVFLFASGEMKVTGVTSIADAEEVVRLMAERLGLLGVRTRPRPALTVENVVASLSHGAPLALGDLEKSVDVVPVDQPGFPGVLARNDDQNTVILLFDSGKMVADGPSVDVVKAALTRLEGQLVSGMKV
jgi:TATA-box binding protein (TBP) (component of TFIID and TFIIIB)